MALVRTIYLGNWRSVIGPGYVIKVQQGGHELVPIEEDMVYSSVSVYYNNVKMAFAFDGKVYFPVGSKKATADGFVSSSPELGDEFAHELGPSHTNYRFIPFGDRLLFWGPSFQGYTFDPRDIIDKTVTAASTVWAYDYAIRGNQVWMLYNTQTYIWEYPFTSSSWITRTFPGSVVANRLCELKGEIYAIFLVDGGVQTLYKYDRVANLWTTVGIFTVPVDNAYLETDMTQVVLFKYNNKLWVGMNIQSPGGSISVRILQIDETTGAIVQDAYALGWIPAAWSVAATDPTARLFEIRDDTNGSEQVFLVRCGGTVVGGWEMYEFKEAAFFLVDSGPDILCPYCGVLYDENTKGAELKTLADSAPSSYATLEITTSDLKNNAVVDIDPRFRDVTNDPSVAVPYEAMTEKGGVGSEGKTALSSKPAGIVALSDIDDDFEDSIIDENLWLPVIPCLSSSVTLLRDYGCGHLPAQYSLEESGGEIKFGNALTDVYVVYTGKGVKCKWFVNGDFQVDITVNPGGLKSITTPTAAMYCLLKTITNRGYGFLIWNESGTMRARAYFMEKNQNFNQGTDSVAAVIDGTIIRIARTAGVWSITLDPSGVAEDLLSGMTGLIDYTEDVCLWMFGLTITTSLWLSGSPPCAIKDVAWAGTGAPSRFDSAIKHDFMWDHITDLGADKVLTAETYVDVKQ